MHSIADLRCIQCHVYSRTLDAPKVRCQTHIFCRRLMIMEAVSAAGVASSGLNEFARERERERERESILGQGCSTRGSTVNMARRCATCWLSNWQLVFELREFPLPESQSCFQSQRPRYFIENRTQTKEGISCGVVLNETGSCRCLPSADFIRKGRGRGAGKEDKTTPPTSRTHSIERLRFSRDEGYTQPIDGIIRDTVNVIPFCPPEWPCGQRGLTYVLLHPEAEL